MDYAKRLRALREDREPKTSQKDIANLLGTTQQYYSEYENGNRKYLKADNIFFGHIAVKNLISFADQRLSLIG